MKMKFQISMFFKFLDVCQYPLSVGAYSYTCSGWLQVLCSRYTSSTYCRRELKRHGWWRLDVWCNFFSVTSLWDTATVIVNPEIHGSFILSQRASEAVHPVLSPRPRREQDALLACFERDTHHLLATPHDVHPCGSHSCHAPAAALAVSHSSTRLGTHQPPQTEELRPRNYGVLQGQHLKLVENTGSARH